MDDIKYLVAVDQFYKFGPKKMEKIACFFPSWKEAFIAGASDLKRAGIEEELIDEYLKFRKTIDPDLLVDRLQRQKINIAVKGETGYPPRLEKIYDPPLVIYYRGNIDISDPPLAVVGARKYSTYGQEVIDTLVAELGRQGFSIVSGLAIGIDSLAHEKALETGAKTIAVLGSGIDNIYPERNFGLAERIISAGGGIISEFPLDTPAFKYNFPQRNRIISGLSLGVLVVEARERSGSLITADFALEQGREVFAVPGNINAINSRGPNELIRKGATPAIKASDIMETLKIEISHKKNVIDNDLSENEKKIIEQLQAGPAIIDELAYLTKLDTKTINSTLSILEIKNIIKNTGNNRYIII
ncbi:DNA-protecting protein DprA [Candidatus Falkowbacteria bacterium]|nr:DNA-protecting protein DprA [Candidatus Falkowbacteria bacterium]